MTGRVVEMSTSSELVAIEMDDFTYVVARATPRSVDNGDIVSGEFSRHGVVSARNETKQRDITLTVEAFRATGRQKNLLMMGD